MSILVPERLYANTNSILKLDLKLDSTWLEAMSAKDMK